MKCTSKIIVLLAGMKGNHIFVKVIGKKTTFLVNISLYECFVEQSISFGWFALYFAVLLLL